MMPRAFPRVRVPMLAACENKFVDDATDEKKFVVVPDVRERVPRVVRPVSVGSALMTKVEPVPV